MDGSGQVGLPLEVRPAGTGEASDLLRTGVTFRDPAPDGIPVGSLLLSQFMRIHGLAWVMDVRKLVRGLCWDTYVARYKPSIKPAFHPAGIVSLIWLGHMLGRTSLRQMEELARTDLRAWWLTGGVMPDYSTLCRFILRHQDDLTEATFEALTRQILRDLGSKSPELFADGTVVQAAASRLRQLKQEAAATAASEARTAAQAKPEDKTLAAKADQAAHVLETVQQRNAERVSKGRKPDATVAPTEPEAVVQPLKQGAGYAPSYKPSAAVNGDRIITAKEVEASNEPRQVAKLLDQSQRVVDEPVQTVMLDAGYNTAEVLDATEQRGVELLCPEGKTTRGDESWVKAGAKFGKDKFTYDLDRDRFTCPQGRALVFEYRCKPSDGKPAFVRYRSKDCAGCPLAEQCLGKQGGQRTVKRYAHDSRKDALRAKMQRPEARARYRKRQATIEPVHGEQKRVQGMTRFRRRGLAKVRLEYSLHCSAHNLRRFTVMRRRRPVSPGPAGDRGTGSGTSSDGKSAGNDAGLQRRAGRLGVSHRHQLRQRRPREQPVGPSVAWARHRMRHA